MFLKNLSKLRINSSIIHPNPYCHEIRLLLVSVLRRPIYWGILSICGGGSPVGDEVLCDLPAGPVEQWIWQRCRIE